MDLIETVVESERIKNMHENGTLDNFAGLVVSSVNIHVEQAYRDLLLIKTFVFEVDLSDP